MLISKVIRRYERHTQSRPCQGDLLQDFRFRIVTDNGVENNVQEVTLPYAALVSQDCDIEHDEPNRETRNQFLPNYLVLPAFLAEEVRTGTHLSGFNLKVRPIDSKTEWQKIIQNKDERYHFLHRDQAFQVPELVIDFKTYYTLPRESFLFLFKSSYLVTINELFRESLSQRFAHFLSRVALPEIPPKQLPAPNIEITSGSTAGTLTYLESLSL
jgi:hypothetical protein